MITTINALKGLYIVLGGNAEDVENISRIPDMVTAFENIDGLAAATKLSSVISQSELAGTKVTDTAVTLKATASTVSLTGQTGINLTANTGDIYLRASEDGDIYIQYGTTAPETLADYIRGITNA